jgi:hypothetical protein
LPGRLTRGTRGARALTGWCPGGRETVAYVSNFYKYYVAYTLVQGESVERMQARKQFLAQSRGGDARAPK